MPEYVPYEHEIVNFKDSKDVFYQIKVKDEQSGKVILQSVKMVIYIFLEKKCFYASNKEVWVVSNGCERLER